MKRISVQRCFLIILLAALTVVDLNSPAQQQTITSYLCGVSFGEDAQITKRLAELSCSANFFGNRQAGQEYAQLREQLPSRDFIRVNQGEPRSFFLAVINGTDQPTLSWLLLIFGLQHPFVMEGKEDIVHRFPVPRDDGSLQAHVFRYEIPPLPPGLHNLSLILFTPVNANTPFAGTVTLHGEMSLYVGDGEPSEVSPNRPRDSAFQAGIPLPSETNLLDGVYLSLMPTPTDEQLHNWQVELAAGQRLDYYIIIRNSVFPGPRDYLVTTFLDGYQLPIEADGQEARAHFRLSKDQQAEVSASLLAPRQPGKYLLFPFAIMNPYNLRREKPRCDECPLGFTESTRMYTIVVEPPK